ncbi:hypothetical protein DL93DRAFT_2167981 [Clavulina sp. PMI_390]|nr:hypothetical protein DL93DRAFT_2167981 [Clavulina sp. PMI_390]
MRRSTRIASKSPASTPPPNGIAPNTDDDKSRMLVDDEVPTARPRKGKATGGKKQPAPKRKKGKLSSMLIIMPNEVISDPADLLHLVQSSKIFALFLLAASSASIWRYARLTVDGLPQCPADITEQQYACLLYGHYCQPNADLWDEATLVPRLPQQIIYRVTGDDEIYKRVDYYIDSRLSRLLVISPIQGTKRGYSSGELYRRDECSAIEKQLNELKGNAAELATFEQQRAKFVNEEAEYSGALLAWVESRTRNRETELSEMRNLRIEDLKGHLEGDGYSRGVLDAIPDSTFRKMPTMRLSKRLSSRTWANQRAEILPHIDKAVQVLHDRAKSISASRMTDAVREECRARLPTLDYLPDCNYSVQSRLPKEAKALLDEWATGDDLCGIIQADHNDALKTALPSHIQTLASGFVTNTSQVVQDHFFAVLQSAMELAPSLSAKEALNLAVAVFQDAEISSIKGYFYPYAHRGYNFIPWGDRKIDTERLQRKWKFDLVGSNLMRGLIELYGMDPSTCTQNDLYSGASYILCLLCGDQGMHWEAARYHWAHVHKDVDAKESSWRRLEDHETASFGPLWTGSQSASGEPKYSCLLCLGGGYGYTLLSLTNHIANEHEDIKDTDLVSSHYGLRVMQNQSRDSKQWPPSPPPPVAE